MSKTVSPSARNEHAAASSLDNSRPSEVIQVQDLCKIYRAAEDVHALRDVSLQVNSGELLAIVGSSGSGKSTLMNVLGCLDRPTSGKYWLDGVDTSSLHGDQLAELRNRRIGFVFQGFNLLARTSALANVELPLVYDHRVSAKDARDRARKALQQVGLADRAEHEPSQLSGGQQQRVAIARALVNEPSLLLADEPTGNLDSRTTQEILTLFQQLNELGMTIVLVTHETEVAEATGRIIELADGRVVRDETLVLDETPMRDEVLARDSTAAEASDAPRDSRGQAEQRGAQP